MSEKITKKDIPEIDAIKEVLISVLSSGRSRSFAAVAGDVSRKLELSRVRTVRLADSDSALRRYRIPRYAD